MNVVIYQVYYDDDTKEHTNNHLFRPYLNEKGLNKYFESKVIIDLFDQNYFAEADYAGVVSWRIADKYKYHPNFKCITNKFDFYYPELSFTAKNVWSHGQIYHGGSFMKLSEMIFQKAGIDVELDSLEVKPVFCNYQICEKSKYKEYVTFLKKMIEIMQDPEIVNKLQINSRYEGSLGRKELIKVFGKPFYTLEPFFLERLFATYAALQGWKGTALPFLKLKQL